MQIGIVTGSPSRATEVKKISRQSVNKERRNVALAIVDCDRAEGGEFTMVLSLDKRRIEHATVTIPSPVYIF